MSWHAILFNLDGHAPPAELSADWRPPPFPDGAIVRRWIDEAIDVAWVDDDRGRVDTDDFEMELRVPAHGVAAAIGVSVVGEGNPIALLAHLCRVHGWAALDASSGAFVDLEEARSSGWEGYLAAKRPS